MTLSENPGQRNGKLSTKDPDVIRTVSEYFSVKIYNQFDRLLSEIPTGSAGVQERIIKLPVNADEAALIQQAADFIVREKGFADRLKILIQMKPVTEQSPDVDAVRKAVPVSKFDEDAIVALLSHKDERAGTTITDEDRAEVPASRPVIPDYSNMGRGELTEELTKFVGKLRGAAADDKRTNPNGKPKTKA